MKATRPGEFVCFCIVTVPIQEGLAHIFLAIDAYSGYVIQTGIEDNKEPKTILKQIYLLTEHQDFLLNSMNGFTLVFNNFQDLTSSITTIIEPHGKLLFDEEFNHKICSSAISSLYSRMERRK